MGISGTVELIEAEMMPQPTDRLNNAANTHAHAPSGRISVCGTDRTAIILVRAPLPSGRSVTAVGTFIKTPPTFIALFRIAHPWD